MENRIFQNLSNENKANDRDSASFLCIIQSDGLCTEFQLWFPWLRYQTKLWWTNCNRGNFVFKICTFGRCPNDFINLVC